MNSVTEPIQEVFKFLLFLLCFLSGQNFRIQNFAIAAEVTPPTWSKLIELAKSNNLELQSAEQKKESSVYLESVSRAEFFPKLSLGISNSEVHSRTQEGVESINSSPNAKLTLTQNIFSGFSDLHRVQQAKASIRSSQANFAKAMASVSYQLKEAVFNLKYSIEIDRYADETVKRRSENLKNVELRFQGGRENQGSVLLAKAYLDEAKYLKQSAVQDLHLARQSLGLVIGLSSNEKEKIADLGAPEDAPPAVKKLENSDRLDFTELAQQNPEVVIALANSESTNEAVAVAKAKFFPSIDASASYGTTESIFFPESQQWSRAWNQQWSIGLSFTWSLFEGGADIASYRSAAAQFGAASKDFELQLRKTIQSLRQAQFDWVSAVEKEKIDEGFRQAAQVRAKIARSKYNNGLITFDDWDLVENDLIAREKSAIASRRDQHIKQAAWEQAQGIGVIK